MAVALVFVVLSPVASMLTRDASGRTVIGWAVVQALATAAAFLIPQVRQIRSEQRQAKAEEREFDTRVEVKLALNDALEPVVRLLGEIAQEPRRGPRDQLRAQAVPLVLTTAAGLTGEDRVRACWFALDPGPPQRLEPQESLGRAGPVTTVFTGGTPAGDAALALVTDNRPLRVDAMAEVPAGQWQLEDVDGYESLLVVPVTVANVAFGMITLDALEPGTFDDDDVALLRLMAGLLGTALSIR
ncbi:GAF domain-containing protein [Microlunatus flavus]|uniref:GAF domain-containing protein n=1 Tax=Microlunatus flavus TaxID=1036181 RepID=A0A1H9MEV9_9ACTN|nr:GAF domain-containing protein [Microlunatus flavus]SER22226.1 GAF domain-containing protein [Microlunatus flavus]